MIEWGIIVGATVWALLTITHNSLWLDELTSIYISRPEMSLSTLFMKRMATDVHPPLYYLLLHFWLQIFPLNDCSVRGLSLFIYMIMLSGSHFLLRRQLSPRQLLTYLAFMALSPAVFHYAQEARNYILLICLSGLIIPIFQALWEDIANGQGTVSNGCILAFVLVSVLLSYAHYWGFIIAGTCTLLLLFHAFLQKRGVVALLICGILIFSCFLPWIWLNLRAKPIITEGQFIPWTSPLTTLYWLFYQCFHNLPNLIVILSLTLYEFLRQGGLNENNKKILVILFIPLTAWLIATVISLEIPIFRSRSMVGLLPFVYFFTGMIIGRSKSIVPILIVICAMLITTVKAVPPVIEQWKESAEFIEQNISCPQGSFYAFPSNRNFHHQRYYLPNQRYQFIPAQSTTRDPMGAFEKPSPDCRVLLWAMHVGQTQLKILISDLDLTAYGPLEIKEFSGGYVVLRGDG